MNETANNSLAPIALFVYNRPQHTINTIEALGNNFLANESELIIFSDGPKNIHNDVEKVNEVRRVASGAKGFKKVTLRCSSKNQGLSRAVISGVSEVCNEYGKIIVMEDDLISSPYFLMFMNEGLNKYEKCFEVNGISAYNLPLDVELQETFFLKYTSSWGWGTWKRAWDDFEPNGSSLLKELRRRKLIKKFDFNGTYVFTKMLKHQIQRKNDSWAIRWYASTLLKDKLVLYPRLSLVKNIGNDGSGVHSGVTKNFDNTVVQFKINVGQIPVEESGDAYLSYQNYFKKIRPFILKRISNRIIRSIIK